MLLAVLYLSHKGSVVDYVIVSSVYGYTVCVKKKKKNPAAFYMVESKVINAVSQVIES